MHHLLLSVRFPCQKIKSKVGSPIVLLPMKMETNHHLLETSSKGGFYILVATNSPIFLIGKFTNTQSAVSQTEVLKQFNPKHTHEQNYTLITEKNTLKKPEIQANADNRSSITVKTQKHT